AHPRRDGRRHDRLRNSSGGGDPRQKRMVLNTLDLGRALVVGPFLVLDDIGGLAAMADEPCLAGTTGPAPPAADDLPWRRPRLRSAPPERGVLPVPAHRTAAPPRHPSPCAEHGPTAAVTLVTTCHRLLSRYQGAAHGRRSSPALRRSP